MKIVFFESDDFLIVNKPAGITVHHDQHHHDHTVWDFIRNKISFSPLVFNSGIVHRLDKPTTGLLLIARNAKTQESFKIQMQKGLITRKYYALVHGQITKKEFTVDVSLTKPGKHKQAKPQLLGSKAITHFRVLDSYEQMTLLECLLETGRTHQIRAHLKFIHHPIINDVLYGDQKTKENQTPLYLHAYYLSFYHPFSKKLLVFTTKLPVHFQEKISFQT